MENNDQDGFWNSVNQGGKENDSLRGDVSGKRRETEAERVNYEILPIQELRKQAEKLKIAEFQEMNKQKLIEEIRKAKNNIE